MNRSYRPLFFSILLLVLCVFLTNCGSGGTEGGANSAPAHTPVISNLTFVSCGVPGGTTCPKGSTVSGTINFMDAGADITRMHIVVHNQPFTGCQQEPISIPGYAGKTTGTISFDFEIKIDNAYQFWVTIYDSTGAQSNFLHSLLIN
ncbi:MAG: hypothetical protein WC539_01500 [Nitrospirota bacterium]